MYWTSNMFTLLIGLALHTSFLHAAVPDAGNPPYASPGARSDSPVAIAVIDSGVDYNHPLLRERIWTNPRGGAIDPHGWDFRENDAYPNDEIPPPPPRPTCDFRTDRAACFLKRVGYYGGQVWNLIRPGSAGHGTHCAGIAAQTSTGAAIMPLRINYSSDQWLDQVIAAVNYAAANQAQVVSMSFGTYESAMSEPSRKLMDVLREVMKNHREILFVIAAGNENLDMVNEHKPILPGAFGLANVILVGAVNAKGELAPFSNVGEKLVDVFAPGVDVVSAWPGGTTKSLSGTSMATPFIAGLAAKLLLADSSLTTGSALKAALLARAVQRDVVFKKTESKDAVLPLDTVIPLRVPVILKD